jgi:hypothetical protein
MLDDFPNFDIVFSEGFLSNVSMRHSCHHFLLNCAIISGWIMRTGEDGFVNLQDIGERSLGHAKCLQKMGIEVLNVFTNPVNLLEDWRRVRISVGIFNLSPTNVRILLSARAATGLSMAHDV